MRLHGNPARHFIRLPGIPSLAAVVCLLCFYVFGPSPPTNEVFAGITMDKLIHAVAFTGITLVLYLSRTFGNNHFQAATAIMVGCAVGFEVLQGFILGRGNSAADVTANMLGVFLAFLISRTMHRRDGVVAPARITLISKRMESEN